MNSFYIKHDSQELSFRNPFGAVKNGEKINLNIIGQKFNKVCLELIFFDGSKKSIEMMECEENGIFVYRAEIVLKEDYIGIINYYFSININEFNFYYGNNNDGLGGEGSIYYNDPRFYQITVYKDFKVPAWYKEGVVYQIFVDRFNNGNDNGKINNPKKNSFIYGDWYDEPMYIKSQDGKIMRWDFYGGNLQGVINKLDYLKELGISAIYLNPIFESISNHKYDTGDYRKIDPMFGDEFKFKELCEKALDRGIRIILDGVFSHTGADSIYFNKYGNYNSLGAYESKSSKYYEWYDFENYPDKYDCWWGIDNHPNVNELDETYEDFIIYGEDSVINKWMKLGACGWRLDVADELPDKFIKDLKEKIKDLNKESILIGEVWEDASNKVSYNNRRKYFFGEELDSVTNYPFKDAVIDFINGIINSFEFKRKIMSLYENYPKEAFYSNLNVLGTHDTERVITKLNIKEGLEKLIMAVAIQMTMPGVPLIYYGDEAGLTGGKDPLNRKTYPWGKENLKVMEIYKKLVKVRNCSEVLKKGDLYVHSLDKDILCYERNFEESKIIIIANRNSEKEIDVILNLEKVGCFGNILNVKEEYISSNRSISISLKPLETKILNIIK